MKSDNIYIQHAMNKGEFKLSNSRYRVDGYCEETNTCYEFNGCFFHGCIKCHKPSKINPISKKLMAELYSETNKKERFIKEQGYNLVTIWEHDWNKN